MITNHFALSHTKLTTFKNTKFVFGTRNRALIDSIVLNNSCIQIHGRLIPQSFTMVIDGVQGVLVMATHPNKFVLMIPAIYLVSIRNDGIPTVLVENSYFYNRVHT
jgi:hypothetical protein